MDSDADKAAKYLERATELLKIAATIKDVKSQQLIVQTAQDYERMASALTASPTKLRIPSSA